MVQQVLLGHGGDGACFFGSVRDALAHEENFARQRVGRRRHGTRRRSVHAPDDLVRLLGIAAGSSSRTIFSTPAVIDLRIRDHAGSAEPASRIARSPTRIAPSILMVSWSRAPARAGYARAVLVDDFVFRVFGVQRAFGLAHRIRVGLLIQAVRGDRHRRCMARGFMLSITKLSPSSVPIMVSRPPGVQHSEQHSIIFDMCKVGPSG